MPADFPTLLQRLLAERHFSGRQFCKLIDRESGFLTDVTKGRSAPSDDVEKWADVLGLTGAARQEFLVAAAWKRTPEAMQLHVQALEARVEYLEQQVAATVKPSKAKRKRRRPPAHP